jgi:hypothetical protein
METLREVWRDLGDSSLIDFEFNYNQCQNQLRLLQNAIQNFTNTKGEERKFEVVKESHVFVVRFISGHVQVASFNTCLPTASKMANKLCEDLNNAE